MSNFFNGGTEECVNFPLTGFLSHDLHDKDMESSALEKRKRILFEPSESSRISRLVENSDSYNSVLAAYNPSSNYISCNMGPNYVRERVINCGLTTLSYSNWIGVNGTIVPPSVPGLSKPPIAKTRKRLTQAKYNKVEKSLVEFIQSKKSTCNLTWAVLQDKAMNIAREVLTPEENCHFSASAGWLQNVLRRNKIKGNSLLRTKDKEDGNVTCDEDSDERGGKQRKYEKKKDQTQIVLNSNAHINVLECSSVQQSNIYMANNKIIPINTLTKRFAHNTGAAMVDISNMDHNRPYLSQQDISCGDHIANLNVAGRSGFNEYFGSTPTNTYQLVSTPQASRPRSLCPSDENMLSAISVILEFCNNSPDCDPEFARVSYKLRDLYESLRAL